jgi:streptomycin 6-kinase
MARKTPVKSLIQRLTDLYFDLSKKAKRDPRTWEEAAVRAKLIRVERIIQRRYGNLYHMTMTNLGDVVIDKDGEEHDMFQLQRKWIC